MKRIAIVMAGALALASCQKTDEGRATHDPASAPAAGTAAQGPDAAVAEIEKSWASGSAEQAMAHYAPGALVFSTGEGAASDDRNKLTRDMGSFFSMKPSDFTVSDRHLQPLGDDAAVSSGIVRFTADVGQGRGVLSARFTQVIERQADGGWKIVHEHMSIPPGPALP